MSIATDVVDAQIAAYRAKDVERFLSHYADDASVVLVQVAHLTADRGIGQSRRRACEHQSGQHVGLEPFQFPGRRWGAARPQVRNRNNAQLASLALTSPEERPEQMRSLQDY